MSVPFIDLNRDVQKYRDEYLELAARVLDSGAFSLGCFVEEFENAFAQYLGVKHVVGLDNGTSALYAALVALGIGVGDEVIVPANSFIATAEAVWMTGAEAVFIDIDPDTQHLNFSLLDSLYSKKTKALIPVHLNGLVVDMDPVLSWAKERNIRVIEDVAQAQGAQLVEGCYAGTIGDIGCFSFYPTKNLGAHGEAGCISTNDESLANCIRALRMHGSTELKYRHDVKGMNLKMSGYQGAVLHAKLSRLDAMNDKRRAIADQYQNAFAQLPIQLPPPPTRRHVYYVYTIQLSRRDELQSFLKERGIGTGIYYPIPIPDQPVVNQNNSCPVANSVSKKILSLPIFPEMEQAEINEVIQAVQSFFD